LYSLFFSFFSPFGNEYQRMQMPRSSFATMVEIIVPVSIDDGCEESIEENDSSIIARV